MLKSKDDFMRETIAARNRWNEEYSHERTIELRFNIIGFIVVSALVQYFYPPLTVATVIAWVGISIYSKLISIYYIILETGNSQLHYYNDIRLTAREIYTTIQENRDSQKQRK